MRHQWRRKAGPSMETGLAVLAEVSGSLFCGLDAGELWVLRCAGAERHARAHGHPASVHPNLPWAPDPHRRSAHPDPWSKSCTYGIADCIRVSDAVTKPDPYTSRNARLRRSTAPVAWLAAQCQRPPNRRGRERIVRG